MHCLQRLQARLCLKDRLAQGIVRAEEDIPDIDSHLQLTPDQIEAVWTIMRSPVSVIKRVPRCFRQQCGEELASLVRAAGTDNSEEGPSN